jgi:hypothetical protein
MTGELNMYVVPVFAPDMLVTTKPLPVARLSSMVKRDSSGCVLSETVSKMSARFGSVDEPLSATQLLSEVEVIVHLMFNMKLYVSDIVVVYHEATSPEKVGLESVVI